MDKIDQREFILSLFDKYHNFLTQTQKQAIQLCYIEDLSLAEAANIIVTTRSAVFDAILAGKKKLLKINKNINGA